MTSYFSARLIVSATPGGRLKNTARRVILGVSVLSARVMDRRVRAKLFVQSCIGRGALI
jgi:hypothetical protein